MEVKEYVKNKTFAGAKGLPEGKTILLFNNLDISEGEFTDDKGLVKKTHQVTLLDSKQVYSVPNKVMQGIQMAEQKNAKGVEVHRSGLKLMDTTYIIYPIM